MLQEVKDFLGRNWFECVDAQAGEIPRVEALPSLAYHCLKVARYLDGHRLPDLDTTPKQSILNVFMLGLILRDVRDLEVINLRGGNAAYSVEDLFAPRLRDSDSVESAIFELLIASRYIRGGYSVAFIDDPAKSPEFVVSRGSSRVFVECKRLAKPVLIPRDKDAAARLVQRGGAVLKEVGKRLVAVFVCESTVPAPWPSFDVELTQAIRSGKLQEELGVGQISVVLLSVPPTIVFGAHVSASDMVSQFYAQVFFPALSAACPGVHVVHERIDPVIGINPGGEQILAVERACAVGLRARPNILSGVGNVLKKAQAQLPTNEAGLAYLSLPPFEATGEETMKLRSDIAERLRQTTRMHAAVLCGKEADPNSLTWFGVVVENPVSTPLPPGFQVLTPNLRCTLNGWTGGLPHLS